MQCPRFCLKLCRFGEKPSTLWVGNQKLYLKSFYLSGAPFEIRQTEIQTIGRKKILPAIILEVFFVLHLNLKGDDLCCCRHI